MQHVHCWFHSLPQNVDRRCIFNQQQGCHCLLNLGYIMCKVYTRQILKGVASYPGHMGGNMKGVVCSMQTVTCHVCCMHAATIKYAPLLGTCSAHWLRLVSSRSVSTWPGCSLLATHCMLYFTAQPNPKTPQPFRMLPSSCFSAQSLAFQLNSCTVHICMYRCSLISHLPQLHCAEVLDCWTSQSGSKGFWQFCGYSLLSTSSNFNHFQCISIGPRVYRNKITAYYSVTGHVLQNSWSHSQTNNHINFPNNTYQMTVPGYRERVTHLQVILMQLLL